MTDPFIAGFIFGTVFGMAVFASLLWLELS